MKLKFIELYLENCDSITIDGKWVGDFLCNDIKTSVERVATNAIIEMQVVQDFFIEIAAGANQEHKELGMDIYSTTVFNRLIKHADIAQISFSLEDENGQTKSYHYYLDWGEDKEDNPYQSFFLSSQDNLYIAVSKNKSVVDFMYPEEANDADAISFRYGMYGLGTDEH